MSDKGIWNVVFGCDSQFMTAAWLRKLNESELRLITHFVEVSIRFVEPKQRLNEFKNVSSSVYFALVHLLSCQFWRCRRSAFKLVSDLHKVYDELSHWLLIGWYEQLSEFVMPNDDSLQFLWASALMASVAVPNLKENDLALLFHLLHHRAISGESLAKSKCSLWKHALKQVKRDCDLTIHSLDGICRHLLGSNGILNANQLLSEAAFSGLATLIQTNPKCKVVLESELCQSLSEHAIKKLTDEQIGIYKTPEGQLFRKPESMDESNSSLSSSGGSGSSGEKRSKEQKKLYKASDEKWEQEIRKKMEEKHGKRKLTKEEELTLEQLSFEAQVRSEVSNIHKNCQRLLQAIETIFKASAHTSRHMIPSLFPLLMPFLRIETIALRVSNTIEVVCLSVDKLPKLLCMHVAYVIGLLYGNAIISHQLQLSKISEIHLRLLQLLVEPSSHTLPAPTFIVILPIVEHAIFHPTVYVAQDTSLSIIEKHLIKDPIYPFAQMSRALIHLLGTAPTLAMRAEKALVCLSEGFSAEHTVELLEGVISPFINVRCACLISLMKISEVFQEANELPNLLHSRVWFAKHDIDETNCQLAQELYEDLEPIQYDQVTQLFDLLSNEDPSIRLIAGSALAGAVKALNENENKPKIDGEPDIDTYLIKILANLFRLYQENLPAPPETDARGKVISVEDNFWRLRAGVAVALASMASVVNINDLSTLFNFLITKGPLNDYNEEVRRLMVSAGIEIVNVHGRENISLLLPIFEENLTKFNKSLKTNSSIVEGIIIFMGTLACFLEPASEKLLGIVRRLVAVKAPSDKVHRLVSERLTPLARLLGSEANQVIENLLNRLRDSSSVNDRRSAAFSLAGLVKGFGLKSFKQLNLIQKLKDLVSAKAANARVGALNAFECLSLRLGRLFEPYVMGILAQLLKAFGDTKSVREAAEAAAKAIMGQLSGHGVKLVLPYLLNSLKDTSNWRTVVAAIELLGSMAFCNPRQLSTCLPQIVAPINSLVNDSNENIQQSARESLSNVASVIRNPEIQAHVTLILNAMYDPKNLTKDALEALISTNYLHVIDAPSLALVVPILDRGLKDRSTSNKKLAAQIVGNMVNLTDHEVLEPYLNLLIPDLLLTLADSNPETRSIAAVALGNISKELGEARMPNLISTLIETMKSDAGTVQRSGAAQGLSQVMNGLSDDRFEQVFVTVVKNLEKKIICSS